MLRSSSILSKSLICLTVLTGIILMFAQSAVPDVSVWKVLLYASGMISALAICLLSVIFVRASFNQWSLRHHAIDTGWLWFNANPPGLDALRKPAGAVTENKTEKIQ
jgi:hypothetical protein